MLCETGGGLAALLAPVGDADQPEGGGLLIWRRREGEDPFGPVRADERVGQLTVVPPGPVEASSQVGPQLGEAGDPFGLGGTDELARAARGSGE